MNKQRSHSSVLAKAAILIASYGMWSDQIVIPMATAMFKDFPEATAAIQNYILSGPAILAIPGAFFAALLTRYMPKKRVLTIGTILFTIAGVGGAFCHNLTLLVILRSLDGFSDGVNSVICTALIGELYEGNERATMYGLNMGASAIYGFLAANLAGIVAQYDWHYAFLLNGITIIAVILSITSLPETTISSIEEPKTAKKERARYHAPFIVWLSMLSMFVMNALYFVIYVCLDLYIADRSLGNSVLSGNIASATTLVSLFASLGFGILYKRLKWTTPIVVGAGILVSYIALGANSSALVVGIACCVAMACYTIAQPYFQEFIADRVPADHISTMMAWYNNIAAVSLFIAPFIPTLIQQIVPGASFHQAVRVVTVLFAGYCVVMIPAVFARRRKAL